MFTCCECTRATLKFIKFSKPNACLIEIFENLIEGTGFACVVFRGVFFFSFSLRGTQRVGRRPETFYFQS